MYTMYLHVNKNVVFYIIVFLSHLFFIPTGFKEQQTNPNHNEEINEQKLVTVSSNTQILIYDKYCIPSAACPFHDRK